jgi:hypothetical protein
MIAEVTARTLSDLLVFDTEAEEAGRAEEAGLRRAENPDAFGSPEEEEEVVRRVAASARRGNYTATPFTGSGALACHREAVSREWAGLEIAASWWAGRAGRAARRLAAHPVAADGTTADPAGRARLERAARAAARRLAETYTRREIVRERALKLGIDPTGRDRRAAIARLRAKLGL